MTAFADYLRRPLQIHGRSLVLVPDLVGPVPISEQHHYVESVPASNTCPTLHVRESDIEEMRERHPGVPVFGLWQVLIHSGLVSFKRTLQVVPVGAGDGHYLYCDLGRAEYSGIYESGFFAADASFSLDEAHELNPALEQLVVPEQDARLAAELRQERHLRQRRAWSSLGIAVAGLLAFALVANLGLARFYALEQQAFQSKSQLLENARDGLDRLRTSRLTEVPNDAVAIERLASLWALDPNLECQGTQSVRLPEMTCSLGDLPEDPSVSRPWLSARYDPKGHWHVRMKTGG